MKSRGIQISYIAYGLLVFSSNSVAFDNDLSINNPNFKPENFLDLKAYEFRKDLDQQWLTANNGWRMTGGSVDINNLFIDGELKISQDFSKKMTLHLHTEQKLFYAPKPVPRTMIEMEFHPWNPKISFSFLSNTAYDKRQVDMGGAIRIGQSPLRYLQFSWLDIDAFYNDKNPYDNSYYTGNPHTTRLEGSLTGFHWRTHFHWEQDSPLGFVMPDESSVFNYKGYNYLLNIEYHLDQHKWAGMVLHGFKEKKHLAEITSNRKQTISYFSIDTFWNQPWPSDKYLLNTGTRFDIFTNHLKNLNTYSQSFDYHFSTWQIYARMSHNYLPHQAWDFGIYIGNSYEEKNYLSGILGDRKDQSIQGKLRTGWEYHSLDKRNTLIVHFSFNLDNLWADPGDGAGMTYQGIF
jgi:hypothetical protein